MANRTKYVTEETDNSENTIFIACSGTAGESLCYSFIDGSFTYFNRVVKNSFSTACVDNLGEGSIQVAFNFPHLDISTSQQGSKTLLAYDAIKFTGTIRSITIYFKESSSVELVCAEE